MEVSVFLSFTFDQMLQSMGRLVSGSSLEIVVHRPSHRGDRLGLSSTLSEHPLLLGDEKSDLIEDDGQQIIESRHKLGGQPYFLHGEPSLEESVDALRRQGYLQVLQMDFPGGGSDAVVKGDWPFGDGVFHLLGVPPFAEGSWRCFWEC